MEILVVKRFDSISVLPHATLVVAGCEPIRFRTQSAAMRAADQIETIKRGGADTYEQAVREWRRRRARRGTASGSRARRGKPAISAAAVWEVAS